MKKVVFILVFSFVTIGMFAQFQRRDSNRIGITAGVNQFTLNSSNFSNKSGMGWNAGLSIRGNFYNDFDMVWAIQFSENTFSVGTRKGLVNEDVKFKLDAAQFALQLSYKIIENHLSVELGPTVQIHGKFTIDSDKESNEVVLDNGTIVKAKELTEISKFDFYPSVGLTAGIRHLRLNIQYQYCVNNMLSGLNSNIETYKGFKANPGILSANLIVYL